MQEISILSDFFTGTQSNYEVSKRSLIALLEGLTMCNYYWLRANPGAPNIYESDTIYVPEFKTEIWKTVPKILEDGFGDCEDLACWRAAEFRLYGVHARVIPRGRNTSKGARLHAVVLLPDRTIEDPSRYLGMDSWQPIMQKIYG